MGAAMTETIEHDAGRMYELSRNGNGEYTLCVVAGGFAMYEVTLKLNDDEIARYKTDGKTYLDDLAYQVAKYHKTDYKDRT